MILRVCGFAPKSMTRSRFRLNVASCKANSSQKYHCSTRSNTRRSVAVKVSPASRVRKASPSARLSCTCSGHVIVGCILTSNTMDHVYEGRLGCLV